MSLTQHPMRRAEREITRPEDLAEVFREAGVLFLALQDDPAPYVIPLSFGWEPGRLYVHTAREGRKLDLLRRCPAVGFSACAGDQVVPAETACDLSVRGRSVVGAGRARILVDEAERRHAMDVIVGHYASGTAETGYRPASLARANLIEISIESLRGKRMG